LPPSSWWTENLLEKLILKRFEPFWCSGLPIFGVSIQLSFYERRIAGSRPTPNVEGQGILLCSTWVALPAARLPPAEASSKSRKCK